VPAPSPRPPAAPIASEDLFGGAKEVQIIHRGSLYRLKQDRPRKLILTK
jgi:hemin uptake protein HemP